MKFMKYEFKLELIKKLNKYKKYIKKYTNTLQLQFINQIVAEK